MHFAKIVLEWRHGEIQSDLLDVDVWPTVVVGRRGRLITMDRAGTRDFL